MKYKYKFEEKRALHSKLLPVLVALTIFCFLIEEVDAAIVSLSTLIVLEVLDLYNRAITAKRNKAYKKLLDDFERKERNRAIHR